MSTECTADDSGVEAVMSRLLDEWSNRNLLARPRVVPVQLEASDFPFGTKPIEAEHVVRVQDTQGDLLTPMHSALLAPNGQAADAVLAVTDADGLWIGIDLGLATPTETLPGTSSFDLYFDGSVADHARIDRLRLASWRRWNADGALDQPEFLIPERPALLVRDVLRVDLDLDPGALQSALFGLSDHPASHPWRRLLRLPIAWFVGRQPAIRRFVNEQAPPRPRHWFLVDAGLDAAAVRGALRANVVLFGDGEIQKYLRLDLVPSDDRKGLIIPPPSGGSQQRRRTVLLAQHRDGGTVETRAHRALLGLPGARPLWHLDYSGTTVQGGLRVNLEPRFDWTIYVYNCSADSRRSPWSPGSNVARARADSAYAPFRTGKLLDPRLAAEDPDGGRRPARVALRRLLAGESCTLRHEYAAEIVELDVLGTGGHVDSSSVELETRWGLHAGRPTRRIALSLQLTAGHGLTELERKRLQLELGRILSGRSEMEAPVDVQVELPCRE